MNSNAHFITQCPTKAAQWIRQGKILAYPTESVWGIGCDPYNKVAVEQILAIKNRPIEKGMIVVTDSVGRIESLLSGLADSSRQRIIESWQNDRNNRLSRQAHTWLLPLSKQDAASIKRQLSPQLESTIPSWITGQHDSVAVRVIAHPLVRQLCQKNVSDVNPYGFIVSTSCNPSQQDPATTFEQAYAYFEDRICYLQGDTLGYTLPSQIRDALTGKALR